MTYTIIDPSHNPDDNEIFMNIEFNDVEGFYLSLFDSDLGWHRKVWFCWLFDFDLKTYYAHRNEDAEANKTELFLSTVKMRDIYVKHYPETPLHLSRDIKQHAVRYVSAVYSLPCDKLTVEDFRFVWDFLHV